MSYKNFSVNKPLVTLQIANTVRKDSCQFFLGKKQGANSSKEKERFPHVIVRLSSKLWYESEKKERMHVLARYEYDAEWNPMTPLQFVLVGTPGPYSSSSLRTTILCPRLPSAPPPPAGRCPAASSQPQGRRPSAGRSAVSPDPVGLNSCSSSFFSPFTEVLLATTQPRYDPALPGCRRLPAHFSSNFLHISKGGRDFFFRLRKNSSNLSFQKNESLQPEGGRDSCSINCLRYKCCYLILRYLPSTCAFCNFI